MLKFKKQTLSSQFKLNIIIFIAVVLFSIGDVFANNLSVTNVSLEERNPSNNTVVVQFDVSWERSWKTKINHDAVWLTIRLYNPSVSPTEKNICQLSSAGLNPTGSKIGDNSNLEISVPMDKVGAFLRPVSYEKFEVVTSNEVELTIDYSSCGFADTDSVSASVFGVEVVFIPEGEFYAGDYATSTATLMQGSSDDDPWLITSPSAMSISNPSTNGFRYVSNGNPAEDATGSSFSIPEDFPNGFGGFYIMKYEITEGQWVEFINSISANGRDNHDLTDVSHKNTDTVKFRNTISCTGSPLICSTERASRSVSYMSWVDMVAFLDWIGLRPITELEYEKASRGPLLPREGEFVWGSMDIINGVVLSAGVEDGSEVFSNILANAHFNNQVLTGGDSSGGASYQQGPVRGGIFATSLSTRITSGSSYYGVQDLSGNLSEMVVTIGNVDGRNFEGSTGDGVLSSASGYEGNANQVDWSGIDGTPDRGVTGALGSGFKGGSWLDQSSGARLRLSDRNDAANPVTSSTNFIGGRGGRSYE